jgi:hypothetical protein
MTTRKGSAGDRGRGSGRARRPEPARDRPKRTSAAAAAAKEPAEADLPVDLEISAAVAHVVKLGYDVIAENIQQGREAAARFRQGKYRLGEAPGEIEVAVQRLLSLARELSTTTFDVCDRLVSELASQKPARDRARHVPPFRDPAPATPSAKPAKPAASLADSDMMKVTVLFEGAPKARAHTASLSRPRKPAAPADVSAQPLAASGGTGKPIAGVVFEADVSIGGIIARVRVPKGQPKGFYSGLVHVKGDPIPLGVLTVELPE